MSSLHRNLRRGFPLPQISILAVSVDGFLGILVFESFYNIPACFWATFELYFILVFELL
jgi:hypothetical protein